MEKITLVRNLFEALEAHNLNKVETYLSDDFTFSGAVPNPVNKKEWADLHQSLFNAIPDLKFNIHDIRQEGEKVIAKVRLEGIHSKPLNIPALKIKNVEASNKKIRLPEETCEISFKGDKIKNLAVKPLPDGGVKGILKQIGAEVPEMA